MNWNYPPDVSSLPNEYDEEDAYIFTVIGEVEIRDSYVMEVNAEITIIDYSEELAEEQMWEGLPHEFKKAKKKGRLVIE